MRAAVLRAPRDLVVTEVDDPEPGPEDVVIRVEAAGICGSDLASFATGAYVRPMQVMGHEFAGTIVAVGSRVRDLEPGIRVTARPLWQCGVCSSCRRGLRQVCDQAIKGAVGYGHSGAFAEYVCIPQAVNGANVWPLGDGTSSAAGALVEPLAVALHGVNRLQVEPDEAVVVLGLGPIGLGAVQALRAVGVRRVVGVDNSALRREIATALGAQIATGGEGIVQAVRDVAGPGPRGRGAGADAVLEASGAAALLSAATRLLRSGGRLGLVALHKQRATPDVNDVVAREIDVLGCYGYDGEFPQALHLLKRGVLQADPLISATFSLGDAAGAFTAQADVDHQVKVHIDPRRA